MGAYLCYNKIRLKLAFDRRSVEAGWDRSPRSTSMVGGSKPEAGNPPPGGKLTLGHRVPP